MNDKTHARSVTLGLLLTIGLCAGCSRYVNPDIVDPREARSRLAADKTLCQALANEYVPPTYGRQRYSPDPTIEGQADQYIANALVDDANLSSFDRCMRDRGWRLVR